jgi:hypothetical protein
MARRVFVLLSVPLASVGCFSSSSQSPSPDASGYVGLPDGGGPAIGPEASVDAPAEASVDATVNAGTDGSTDAPFEASPADASGEGGQDCGLNLYLATSIDGTAINGGGPVAPGSLFQFINIGGPPTSGLKMLFQATPNTPVAWDFIETPSSSSNGSNPTWWYFYATVPPGVAIGSGSSTYVSNISFTCNGQPVATSAPTGINGAAGSPPTLDAASVPATIALGQSFTITGAGFNPSPPAPAGQEAQFYIGNYRDWPAVGGVYNPVINSDTSATLTVCSSVNCTPSVAPGQVRIWVRNTVGVVASTLITLTP